MSPGKPDHEERKWNAFWHTFPGWLRASVTSLFGAAATWLLMQQTGLTAKPVPVVPVAPVEVYRQVIREELHRGMAPLAAGFKESIKDKPDFRQVAILRAMEDAREKVREDK